MTRIAFTRDTALECARAAYPDARLVLSDDHEQYDDAIDLGGGLGIQIIASRDGLYFAATLEHYDAAGNLEAVSHGDSYAAPMRAVFEARKLAEMHR